MERIKGGGLEEDDEKEREERMGRGALLLR